MAIRFTDLEISAYILEPKILPPDAAHRFALRAKRGHDEKELDLHGNDGTLFRILIRQNQQDVLAFSVILALVPQSGMLFRLRRYNGKYHQHTNPLERESFYDFHIHSATERYQQIGAREDHYAVPSSSFGDRSGAVRCMLGECGFSVENGDQMPLF
jgi:hypothetical protein